MKESLSSIISLLFVATLVSGTGWGQADVTIIPPKVAFVENPVQPDEAKRSGLGGRVNIRLLIAKDGRVKRIEEPTGPDNVCPGVQRPDVVALRIAAKKAAENARFSPAIKNGKPFETYISLGLDFPKLVPDASTEGETTDDKDLTDEPGSTMGVRQKGEVEDRIITGGKLKKLRSPSDSKAALDADVRGTVVVRILIDEAGKVFSVEPVSGLPLLQPAAIVAACKVEFTPRLRDGRPVSFRRTLEYVFAR